MKKASSFVFIFIFSFILSVSVFALSDEQLNTVFVPVNGLHFVISDSYHESWVSADYSTDSQVFMYRNAAQSFVLTRDAGAIIVQDRKNANGDVVNSREFICDRVFYQNPDDVNDVIYTQSGSYVNEGYPGTYDPELLNFNDVVGSFASSVIVETFKQFESIYIPPVVQSSKSFSIPVGYAAYFKASGTLDLSCRFPTLSSLSPLGAHWGETGQMISGSSSLPSSVTDFPLSDSIQIVWGKGPNRNVLNQTYYGRSQHDAYSGWTVIYNPIYRSNFAFGTNAEDPQYYNGTIQVSGTIGEIRLFPVTSQLGTDGVIGSGSGDEYIDVSVDPDSDTPIYTDPSGDVLPAPEPGGNTIIPEYHAYENLISRFASLLTNFFDSLLSIFTKGEEAILSLIGIAAPFFSLIGMIFTWLPSDIVAFITAAVTATVFLGLLKHFL